MFKRGLFILIAVLIVSGGAIAKSKPGLAKANAGEAGKFDYYVLSLSWSPAYCATHPTDQQQCGTKKHGFVLHGLWPQYTAGGYPESCKTDFFLDEKAREFGNSIFPSPKLVAHEWDKHGTCAGLSALNYFEFSQRAYSSVTVPQRLEPGNRVANLTARDISGLIRGANPGLNNNMLTVHCGGPELSEVRVCMSKDLKPQACGNGMRSSCRAGTIRVPGVR